MIVEYAGLTHDASTLIERLRVSPAETKSDILVRVLSQLVEEDSPQSPEIFELGQGAHLRVGEEVILFLSEGSKRSFKPDATATVREDGFYLFGKKVSPSKGSLIQPAMRQVQEKINHRNEKGEIISLSAWRQWHVMRNGKLVRLIELKDPALAHKRGRTVTSFSTPMSLDEFGL